MIYNVLQAIFGFLATTIGLAGSTWGSGAPRLIRRVTFRGWIALTLAIATCVVTVVKEVVSERELHAKERSNERLQAKLIEALDRLTRVGTGTPVASKAANELGQALMSLPAPPAPKSSRVAAPPVASDEPPWLRLARGELGVKENKQPPGNPRILEFLRSTSLASSPALSEDIPWSAAFVNWALKKSGVATPDSPSIARWLDWGIGVDSARVGCVVILRFPGDIMHIGFVAASDTDGVTVLAGNSTDEVQFRRYSTKLASAYRCPPGL